MKLTHVLEAERQANPGLRLYHLIQERQRIELAKLWNKAHQAEEATKHRFLDELVWIVSQTRPVLRASESSDYFTITFESQDPDKFCRNAELTIHIGPEQGDHYDGCFVQVRRDGKHWTGMAHRRMQISPNDTPVQICAAKAICWYCRCLGCLVNVNSDKDDGPAVNDCFVLGFPPFSWNEIAKLRLRALGCGVFSAVLLTTEHEHANCIRTEH